MKTKTIKKIIDLKFEEFVNSIDDPNVQNLVRNNTIITGGCIPSMLLGEDVNDFDLYFRNKETCKAVAQYYVNKFNEDNKNRKNRLGGNGIAYVLDGDEITVDENGTVVLEDQELTKEFANQGIISNMIASTEPGQIKIIVRSDGIAESENNVDLEDESYDPDTPTISPSEILNQLDDIPHEKNYFNDKSYKPVFLTTNAITLSGDIQLIIRFYGEPEDIHANYDFVHCTNYWDSKFKEVTLNKDALESILTKSLYYVGSRYPLCSIIRTRKFIKRGWKITAGEYLKMAIQLNTFDLYNPVVLEDQLIGVDTMYFQAFIQQMHFDMAKNGIEDISTLGNDYIISVIDKIFN